MNTPTRTHTYEGRPLHELGRVKTHGDWSVVVGKWTNRRGQTRYVVAHANARNFYVVDDTSTTEVDAKALAFDVYTSEWEAHRRGETR